MNIDALLNDLEDAERTFRGSKAAFKKASERRSELIHVAVEAGIPGAVIARLLGVSRQRIHQLT